jgi:maltooligosyltrehalose trehalohydrolase
LPDPTESSTFTGSKLDWSEAERHAPLLRLHKDLLRLRREDASFRHGTSRRVDGAVIGPAAILFRILTKDPAGHRLLLVNLGKDLPMDVVAEPLYAPPSGHQWTALWSSEHPDYNGAGRRPSDTTKYWILPSDTALVLKPEPRQPAA